MHAQHFVRLGSTPWVRIDPKWLDEVGLVGPRYVADKPPHPYLLRGLDIEVKHGWYIKARIVETFDPPGQRFILADGSERSV